ncbi:MAG: GerMN domain-containing protein [Candidatus Paceibacterota bacterium]
MEKFINFIVIILVVVTGFYIITDINESSKDSMDNRKVILFYYDSDLDIDEDGDILCSNKGLVSTEKNLEVNEDEDVILATLNALIEGEGFNGEVNDNMNFPLENFSLESYSLDNGDLILNFSDPNYISSGGSCRVTVLANQVYKTIEQFENIENIEFNPEHVFQP